MQEMIGLLASAIIGATIILILAVIAWRGQHHTIAATQYSAAKEGTLDFAEVIEEDISNLGAGLSSNTLADPTNTNPNYDGGFYIGGGAPFDSTGHLTFATWEDRTTETSANFCVDDDVVVVRYEWTQTGTVQVLDGLTNTFVTKDTYIIRREIDGTPSGESVDTLTDIKFEFFRADGQKINLHDNPTQGNLVRTVRVRLKAVSPLGGGDFVDPNDPSYRQQIDETRWSRTIRPINLARVSNSCP